MPDEEGPAGPGTGVPHDAGSATSGSEAGTQLSLAELARDPRAFDTRLEGIYRARDAAMTRIRALQDQAHAEAGDERSYPEGRPRSARHRPSWGMSLESALDGASPATRQEHDDLWEVVGKAREDIQAAEAEYWRNPWPRFFPAESGSRARKKGTPHIHGTLSCTTLYTSTPVNWAPEFAGKPAREAVEALGKPLCRTCFQFESADLYDRGRRRNQNETASRKPARTRPASPQRAQPAKSGR